MAKTPLLPTPVAVMKQIDSPFMPSIHTVWDTMKNLYTQHPECLPPADNWPAYLIKTKAMTTALSMAFMSQLRGKSDAFGIRAVWSAAASKHELIAALEEAKLMLHQVHSSGDVSSLCWAFIARPLLTDVDYEGCGIQCGSSATSLVRQRLTQLFFYMVLWGLPPSHFPHGIQQHMVAVENTKYKMWIVKAQRLLMSQPAQIDPYQMGWGQLQSDPTATVEEQNAIHRGWFDDDPMKFAMLTEVMTMHFEVADEHWRYLYQRQCRQAISAYSSLLSAYISHLTSQLDVATQIQNKIVGAVSSLSVMAFTAFFHWYTAES